MDASYARQWKIYGRSGVDLQLPTAVSPVIVAKTNVPSGVGTRTIMVQRVVFSPSTYPVGGGILTLVDSVTGVVVATVFVPDRAPGPDPLDFGVRGVALAAGSHLLLGVSTPLNGRLLIDAYQKF